MTREKAVEIAKVLQDVEDFEILYEAIDKTCVSIEGNFTDFFNEKLYPLLEQELKRRKDILANI